MGLGFPAITFQTLTNETDPMALTNEEASWFGEFYYIFIKTFHAPNRWTLPSKRLNNAHIIQIVAINER